MSAVRLARAATGRDLVLKFSGCYHGHADSFLVAAGSGLATLGIPGSPGVPSSLAGMTITARYNDLDSVRALFAAHSGKIAVIAVEPVAANMGVVAPAAGFLEGLRAIADKEGALLLFDEVISGFRLAKGGAQEITGVRPDLTCLGKIIASTKPSGLKKAVTASKALSASGATCKAALALKLPKKFKGKKVPVKLTFAGNAAVQSFSNSLKLKIK